MPTTSDRDDELVRWRDTPPELRPRTREILEVYSKIPADEVIPHVSQIRDKAWAIHPYPCVASFRFIEMAIGQHKLFPEILSRVKDQGQVFLDLGCAFGQDIRRLVADGAPSERCYGSDLRLEFVDLGYELFRDRDTLRSEFIEGDIFDANNPLHKLDGKVDIANTSSFFHLFPLEKQKTAARRVLKLLKPQSGSLIVGRQAGSDEPGEYSRKDGGGTSYRHNLETFKNFWDEIGAENNIRFEFEGSGSAMAGQTSPEQTNAGASGMNNGMQYSVRWV